MKPSSSNRQHGAALIVSMVLLVAITLLGVFVMSGSRLEWLMASNTHLQTDTYMQTELNLKAIKQTLRTTFSSPTLISGYLWGSVEGYFNDDPAAPSAPLPTGVNGPDNVDNWRNGTYSNFVVDYLGVTTISTKPVYVFRVWVYSSDAKGVARALKSIHMAMDTPSPPPAFANCRREPGSPLCWLQTGVAEVDDY